MIGWRTFQALEEDDKRLRYARYVFMVAVTVFGLGLLLALTVEPVVLGTVLAVLPVPIILCYPIFNCAVSKQIQNRRRANQRRPGVPPAALLNLYPQTTATATTETPSRPVTLQADLPTYHEARSTQQYPVVPSPDVAPRLNHNADNEPPPPSYEDAVLKD
ncbi:Hypp5114 [Branchiostoma lanceolatum]|uniref:Hypp5114 protein n=1 Tax=Branchiostoma lanceolatum TaxID=7740 RepID=A0A8K0AGB5_BRALA|nr:Hypp5114 [Branchiostoma lanceolatum]